MAARISIARRRCLTGLGALAAASALAAPPAAAPARQAEILRVDRSFIPSQSTPIPGAGVRAFREPAAGPAGSEQFDIHWLAPPPGLPPGAILMLEAIHTKSPTVQNQVQRLPERSAGRMHSTLTIPASEVARIGRVQAWRVSLAWRGRILARRASSNWPR